MSNVELDGLMSRASRGDHGAALAVLYHWHDCLCRVIRDHLDPRVRRVFDPDDCFQSLALDLVRKPCDDDIFTSRKRMLGYLKAAAWHKAVAVNNGNLNRKKSSMDREVRLSNTLLQADAPAEQVLEETEVWRVCHDKLAELERQLLRKLFAGTTPAGPASLLGLTRRELAKIMDKVRRLLTGEALV
jgi:hypothetical protein